MDQNHALVRRYARGSAERSGYGADKKIKGRKRHIVTDTEGHWFGYKSTRPKSKIATVRRLATSLITLIILNSLPGGGLRFTYTVVREQTAGTTAPSCN